jgi:hypothetical protein
MARYVAAARSRRVADYVVLAHDGHGVNSYAIHYFLVRQPLCLFLQVAWGGVYTDAAQATAHLEHCFSQATRLVQTVARARTEGQMVRDDRLIVVATDFYESSVEYRRSRRSSRLESYASSGAALEAALRILPVGGGPPWRTH